MDSLQAPIFKNRYPTLEQNQVLLSDARCVLIRALAGSGKTTTLALKAADLLRAKGTDARILMLAHSTAGVAAIKTRLSQFLRSVPPSVFIMTLEALCAELLREQGDPVVMLDGTLQGNMRIQQAHAALLQDAREAGENDLIEYFADGVDLQAFREFERLAKQRLLARDIERSGMGAREYCQESELDYAMLRLLMKYERLRLGMDNEALFYAPGDCTYGLAGQLDELDFDEVYAPLRRRYHAVLFDELQDLNEASLVVLRHLVSADNGTFVGVGDFNQHILAGAFSVFGDSLEHLREALPTDTKVFSLNTTYRFGGAICDALNPLFGVAFEAHYAKKAQLETIAYQDDEDCVRELVRLHALVQSGVPGFGPEPVATRALNVILRSPAESFLIEWRLAQEDVHYTCRGMPRFYQRREVAMVLALVWASSGCTKPGVLSQSILMSAIEGLLRYLRRGEKPDADRLANGQFDDQAFGDWPDDLDAKAMAAQLLNHPERMRAFLKQLSSYRPRTRGPGLLEAWLELTPDDCGDAQNLCRHPLILRIFEQAPISRTELDEARHSMQALSQLAVGLSADEFLGQLTLMVRSTIDHFAAKEVPTLHLLSVEECKGHEYEFVAVPFVERGRFPRSAAVHDSWLERNRLYVALTRARKGVWMLESATRPVHPGPLT